MKTFFCVAAGIFAISSSTLAQIRGPVALEPVSAAAPAGRVHYQFQLIDTKGHTVVGENELNISHEKKLHFIVYDPALKEFQHVHPEFDGTHWSVDLDVPVDGDYFVWAQGELASSGAEFTAGNRLAVSGGRPAWPAPPAWRESRSATSGVSRASLSRDKLKAGKMAMLTLTFSRTDGTKPDLTPYLGAFAHAVVVPAGGGSLMHVHPMDGDVPTEGMLHITFPEAGPYRIWVQFVDGGTLRTVALSILVN